jgi:hypothetical protein
MDDNNGKSLSQVRRVKWYELLGGFVAHKWIRKWVRSFQIHCIIAMNLRHLHKLGGLSGFGFYFDARAHTRAYGRSS